MAIIKMPTREQLDAADQIYCTNVGRICVWWAKLHEDLAQLYFFLLSPKDQQAKTAWYSHRSDAAQRELLRAALQTEPPRSFKDHPSAKADFAWMLNTIDELAIIRNTATHAAVSIIWGEEGPSFEVDPFSSNPKLRKCSGTDLLPTLTDCEQRLEDLVGFNRLMASCITALDASFDWPSRPRGTQTSVGDPTKSGRH
jgi:hypothetical protein